MHSVRHKYHMNHLYFLFMVLYNLTLRRQTRELILVKCRHVVKCRLSWAPVHIKIKILRYEMRMVRNIHYYQIKPTTWIRVHFINMHIFLPTQHFRFSWLFLWGQWISSTAKCFLSYIGRQIGKLSSQSSRKKDDKGHLLLFVSIIQTITVDLIAWGVLLIFSFVIK